jgi:hypothetical protein
MKQSAVSFCRSVPMNARIAFASLGLVGLLALGDARSAELSSTPGGGTPAPSTRVTVEMTAVTLGDDCGGGRPSVPTKSKTKSEAKSDEDLTARSESRLGMGKARRACEQTSMQLSVISPAGAVPTELHVKKVELFDDAGTLLGELTPRTPTRWKNAVGYEAWDEKVLGAETLSVSYALSQPDWSKVTDRWNKTFTLRAVITVAGADQTLQRDVVTQAPTSLPPNVRT